MKTFALPDYAFFLLAVLVTLTLLCMLMPFSGAIVGAVVLAVVFGRMHKRIFHVVGKRPNLAAILAVAAVVMMVIIPLSVIQAELVDEAVTNDSSDMAQSALDELYVDIADALPLWALAILDRYEWVSADGLPDRPAASCCRIGHIMERHASDVAMHRPSTVAGAPMMSCLLFIFFRAGRVLVVRTRRILPPSSRYRMLLSDKSAAVIRATVRGNIAVSVVHGVFGALIFLVFGIPWPLLWGAAMACLSLVPTFGAASIWGAVVGYLLLADEAGRAVVLGVHGVLVIGLVDNVLRTALVGKGARLPGCMALLSAISGVAFLGTVGFVFGPVVAALFVAARDLSSNARAVRAE